MATQIVHFYVSDEVKAGQVGTLQVTFADNSPVKGLESTDFRLFGVKLSNFETTDNGVNWTGTLTPIDGFSGQASIQLVANAYRNALDNSLGTAFHLDFDIDPTIVLPPKAPTIHFDNTSDTLIDAIIQLPHAKVGHVLTVNGIVYPVDTNMIEQGLSLKVLPNTQITTMLVADDVASTVTTITTPHSQPIIDTDNSIQMITDYPDIIEISHYPTAFEKTPTDINPTLENIHHQLSHSNYFVFGETSAVDVAYLFGNAQSDTILLPSSFDNMAENLSLNHTLQTNMLGLSDLVENSQQNNMLMVENHQTDVNLTMNYDLYQTAQSMLLVQTEHPIL